MKKIFNNYFIIGIVLLFMFGLMIVLLQFDTAKLGINESEVGLQTINKKFLPNDTSSMWDDLSDLVLYSAIVVLCIFAVKGLLSLFDTGNLFKVEKELLVFGFSIVFIIALWILFDFVIVINNRPYFENESSFPSTHVLLVTYISLYTVLYVSRKDDYKSYLIPVSIIGAILSLLVFIGRIKSGNHFFTDCLGAVILAFAIFFVSFGVIKYLDSKENNVKIQKNSDVDIE
ncbi:MAG: phosphatase PAP2 family protein [Acholeplasmatales bacterium]|nr:phosphatase PAP2 family protein [Acholeplasmatales bacterium]